MKRDEFPTFIDWWAAHETEYRALSDAEDGNPTPLADLIMTVGHLATQEARQFVADRLEGREKPKGSKRTIAQQAKELGILSMIRNIQEELGCSEYHARGIFMNRHPDITNNEDTLKTYIRRAKDTLKEMMGRKPPPVVQKRRNPEPR